MGSEDEDDVPSVTVTVAGSTTPVNDCAEK